MTELTAEMIVDFAVPQELDISPDGTRVVYAFAPNSKKEEHASSSLWVAMPDFQRVLGGSAPWEGAGPHPHARYSPISFAQEVKTPVLILHGQEDPQVPVSQAIGFHRALREQGVPTELVVYPREPHSISERAHQLDVLKRVRGWYDRWLRS